MPRLMRRRAPICGLVSPSATRRTTSSSVGVRLDQPVAGRPRRPRARRAYSTAWSRVSRAPSAAVRSNAVALSNRRREDPIRERHYVNTLLARQVDGIIVTGRRADPRPPIGSNLPVPVVNAMAQSTDSTDCSIVRDDEQGGRLAAEHLLATGRIRIGHITGPQRFVAARLRAKGLERALAAAGSQLAGPGVLYGEWSEAWRRQAARILLQSTPDLDAVFCGSDQLARGVADMLRELRHRVPDKVALVGFDNWEVMAATCRPPLTTVDMNLTRLGRSAPDRLLAAIDGDPSMGCRPCRANSWCASPPARPRRSVARCRQARARAPSR
jgi:DNA-binding LacI/PurR family transcriptional regulator